MKDLGKGIATAGIWVGVGLIAFAGGEAAMALPKQCLVRVLP